jgi:hypothetical protein
VVVNANDPESDQPETVEGIGADLLAAIRSELADERARKTSLESRALTLSAAAAAAIALVFGLGSDYTGRWQVAFYVVLGVSGVSFLAAAANGWWAARVVDYEQPQLEEFKRLLDEGWEDSLDDFRIYVADGVMTALESARSRNDARAQAFERAFSLLLAGSAFVAIELLIVVLDSLLD